MASLPNLQEREVFDDLVPTVGFAVDCVVAEWRCYEFLLAWPLQRISSPEYALPVTDPV
jgi:hypothetical protein